MNETKQTVVEEFQFRCERQGSRFRKVSSHQDLVNAIEEIVLEEKAKRLICWDIDQLIQACGSLTSTNPAIELTVNRRNLPREKLLSSAKSADIGLTWGDCGIAETGSVLVGSGVGQSRWVSLLPSAHIAILPSSSLFQKRADAFRHIYNNRSRTPSAYTLISGPSKTGDIDGKINVGVHGPKRMYVLLIS